MTAKQESNLLIIIMITDTIGWHEVLLPMNQNYDKIWKKLDIGCMFSLKKKQLTLRNTRQQCAYDAILSTYTGMTYELSL